MYNILYTFPLISQQSNPKKWIQRAELWSAELYTKATSSKYSQ